jgi:hypothetical protein
VFPVVSYQTLSTILVFVKVCKSKKTTEADLLLDNNKHLEQVERKKSNKEKLTGHEMIVRICKMLEMLFGFFLGFAVIVVIGAVFIRMVPVKEERMLLVSKQ